jgi:hypothetical protein
MISLNANKLEAFYYQATRFRSTLGTRTVKELVNRKFNYIGGRSVGIVRSRTQTMELVLYIYTQE